jgi:membrane protease YdiL (CAAX protease family)
MPLSETLFFRGVFQQTRAFWETAIYCTVFQFILFFPMMNQGPYPLIIGVGLVMANLMYGYVRDRNGLAAAWICQITVNLVLFFIPALMN